MTDSERAAVLSVLSDREAADLWGVSKQAVNLIRHRLAVPHPPRPAVRFRARVAEVWAQVPDPVVIARVTGRSVADVRDALRELKLLAPGPSLAVCGTRAAYNRHLRYGEPVDDACRAANARRRKP